MGSTPMLARGLAPSLRPVAMPTPLLLGWFPRQGTTTGCATTLFLHEILEAGGTWPVETLPRTVEGFQRAAVRQH